MMNSEIYWKWRKEFCDFSDNRIIEEIDNVEVLLDDDTFLKSWFYDESIDIYEALRDECVELIRKRL